MDIQVVAMGDGALLGFTYFSKGDIVIEEDNDWSEFNLYLIFIRITFRWF